LEKEEGTLYATCFILEKRRKTIHAPRETSEVTFYFRKARRKRSLEGKQVTKKTFSNRKGAQLVIGSPIHEARRKRKPWKRIIRRSPVQKRANGGQRGKPPLTNRKGEVPFSARGALFSLVGGGQSSTSGHLEKKKGLLLPRKPSETQREAKRGSR